MKQHLNTLFVTTEGAYLSKDGQAVAVRKDAKVLLRIPLHNLDGIVCFGRVGFSPSLAGACAQAGVRLSLLDPHGRFRAAVVGFTPGNVLLRREQYRVADDPDASCAIARQMVAAKIANCRNVLLRAAREARDPRSQSTLGTVATRLANQVEVARTCPGLDILRGLEGDAAAQYFTVFDHLSAAADSAFRFIGRSRRPPLDPLNALLSFLYALLAADARSACEAAGLDAAVGFLHRDRPGRPGLALDLMEEFRPIMADRLALSLINRRQVAEGGFQRTESGAVLMDEKTRRTVLVAWQKRKEAELLHPFLGEKVTVGLLVHLQARLLARRLRGDLDAYPPFVWK